TVGLMEALYVKAGTPQPDFSEQFLQWSVYSELRAPLTDGGSNISYNFSALRDFGIPVESAWRYETYPWDARRNPSCSGTKQPTVCFTNGDPSKSAKEAQRFGLPFGVRIESSAIKPHLVKDGTPAVVSLPF